MSPGSAEVGSAANSYEIIAKLATGGMAEIFLARGASTAGVERYVVLKRVLRERAGDAAFVRMFLDEARLAAQLQHPNIAQVYDVGKLGDSYFFTMEYVHGETVRALLQRSHALRRPIPIGSVLAIVAGAAAGLHHAHERKGFDGRALGIVHRDVSPSNLMLSYEGHVKVVDFGVAKADHRATETKSGTIKGKISYLSPEQARGTSTVDRRSDLFSLGIVMWELLTLERLYRRESDFENMVAIVSEGPQPPSALRPEVPRELDALVLRLLAKDPAQRFQTADELHAAIEEVAVRVGTSLSSASLARYVRELFGERPEPWVEMRSQATHGGAVTVTSEPIPASLVSAVSDSLDAQLGAVPDLSPPSISSGPHRPPSEMLPTTPFPTVAPGAQTVPYPTVAPPHATTLVPVATGFPASSSGPSLPVVTHPLADPSWRQLPERAPAPPPARRNRPIVIVIAGAALLGVVLAFVVAGHHGSHAPSVVAPADAAAASLPAPAPVVAMRPIDAVAAPAAPAAPAIDAAPAPAAAPPPDAAPAAHAEPAHEHAPAEHHERSAHSHARTGSAEELVKDLRAERYVDVVVACSNTPALAAQDPVSCVLAACHLHDATRAQRWMKNAASKRQQLAAACAAAGTWLESPKTEPAKPDCSANPLDCQH